MHKASDHHMVEADYGLMMVHITNDRYHHPVQIFKNKDQILQLLQPVIRPPALLSPTRSFSLLGDP